MPKQTHLSNAAISKSFRLGGVSGADSKGGQDLSAPRVTTNWYPVNLPAASAGTPQNSDCKALLNGLAPLVAYLTIQQSVFLANCYRTVQPGVVAGGTFTVNGVTSGAATSWFDRNLPVKEAVAVDVVNKNPALMYDLALRLAVQAARQVDADLANLFSGFTTIAAVGAQGTIPTQANLTTQINALPNTGEPVIGVFASEFSSSDLATPVIQSLLALGMTGTQSVQNGQVPLFKPTSANKQMRLLASDQVVVTGAGSPVYHNLIFLPSAMAYASADQGTSLGSSPVINPNSGVNQFIQASNYFDPEYQNQPQLSLQLVIGNTGSGAQTVYVNCLGAAICINAGNGAVVLS